MLVRATQSKRSRDKVEFEGFLFTKEKTGVNGNVYWRCEKRSCKARLTVCEGREVCVSAAHNHAHIAGRYEAEDVRACSD